MAGTKKTPLTNSKQGGGNIGKIFTVRVVETRSSEHEIEAENEHEALETARGRYEYDEIGPVEEFSPPTAEFKIIGNERELSHDAQNCAGTISLHGEKCEVTVVGESYHKFGIRKYENGEQEIAYTDDPDNRSWARAKAIIDGVEYFSTAVTTGSGLSEKFEHHGFLNPDYAADEDDLNNILLVNESLTDYAQSYLIKLLRENIPAAAKTFIEDCNIEDKDGNKYRRLVNKTEVSDVGGKARIHVDVDYLDIFDSARRIAEQEDSKKIILVGEQEFSVECEFENFSTVEFEIRNDANGEAKLICREDPYNVAYSTAKTMLSRENENVMVK